MVVGANSSRIGVGGASCAGAARRESVILRNTLESVALASIFTCCIFREGRESREPVDLICESGGEERGVGSFNVILSCSCGTQGIWISWRETLATCEASFLGDLGGLAGISSTQSLCLDLPLFLSLLGLEARGKSQKLSDPETSPNKIPHPADLRLRGID